MSYETFCETIIARWNAGDSSNLIAKSLGTSRGCVIGIVHRAREKGRDVREGPPQRGLPRKPPAPLRPSAAAVLDLLVAAEGRPVPVREMMSALAVTRHAVIARISHLRKRPEMERKIQAIKGFGYAWCDHA